ncbi:MAG: diguanylate cyclase (GGDEF)-like protein [Phycisphaerales bacterium]|jgi:diguanylate cyclase (GGDEF)-like protein
MTNPISRILVIDDNEAIHKDFIKVLCPPETNTELDSIEAELFDEALREVRPIPYDIVACSQGLEGVEAAALAREQGSPFSLAFVDMRMPPGIDGLETIERMWKEDPDIEVVICSAYSDYTWDEISERLGQSDRWLLLRKPFDTAEVLQLAAALCEKWRLRQAANITLHELNAMVQDRTSELENQMANRELANRALAKSARTDPLTGLSNRTVAMDRIREACAHLASNPSSRFSVLFLDLDNFKLINDSLGHDAGDKALIAIANRTLEILTRRLRSQQRAEDSVFRIGGDEFVIVLDDKTSIDRVESIADELLAAIAEPFDIDGRNVVVGLSIGMAVGGEDFQRPEDVLSAADAAMYHAKHQGRGRLERFSRPLFEAARERAVLADDLRRAIDQGDISLVYEPIFCTKTGMISSFEALARWNHHNGMLVPPDRFIPIAEETGLIVPLGEQILHQACLDLIWFTSSGHVDPSLKVNVNFSKRQLVEPNIAARVHALTNSAGVDSSRLNVEVTETAIMDGPDRLRKVIDQFRQTGVGVHMDDFGTGLSSLSYLQRFPFETIKIDRSFVSAMSSSERDAAIVRAILTMAKELGMEVIAEGVETRAQADELAMLKCEYLQGHLLSRPLTRDGAKALFDDVVRQQQPKRDAA